MYSKLSQDGVAGFVLANGSLSTSNKQEYEIRKNMLDKGKIDCIITCPDKLFYTTGIPVSLWFVRKGKKDNNVLFIDASNECIKVTNNNKLTPDNIDRIVDAYVKRETDQYFCKLVSYEEIQSQKYNLSVSTYVEQEEKHEEIDIVKLNKEIDQMTERGNELRALVKQIISDIEGGAIHG